MTEPTPNPASDPPPEMPGDASQMLSGRLADEDRPGFLTLSDYNSPRPGSLSPVEKVAPSQVTGIGPTLGGNPRPRLDVRCGGDH
jgi:hypothetical protein